MRTTSRPRSRFSAPFYTDLEVALLGRSADLIATARSWISQQGIEPIAEGWTFDLNVIETVNARYPGGWRRFCQRFADGEQL